MSNMPILKMDWCTYEAAKYAVENWHYSRCMPAGKTVKCGVWENGKFTGAVIFALGANGEIASMYGATAELARVALASHMTAVTRIVSIALKMLKLKCPKLDAVISYADLDRHTGIIYKAGNWKEECIVKNPWLYLFGDKVHPRTAFARYGTRSITWLRKNVDPNAKYLEDSKGKKRFVWFFDSSRRAGSKANVAPVNHTGGDGVSPIPALQTSKDSEVPAHGETQAAANAS